LAAVIEAASYLAYFRPQAKPAFLLMAAFLASVAALKDLRYAFALLVVDAVMGGHGHLLSADFGGFRLSLRMALFAVVTVGWLLHVMRGCSRLMHFSHTRVSGPLLLLIVAAVLGAVRGWSRGNSLGEIFADANGYAYVLLVPITLDLFADRKSFAWLTKIFAGAAAWLAAKSLLLLYVFTHAFPGLQPDLFRWQRTFWLSEITFLPGGLARVFSASDVMLLPAVFVGALLAWRWRSRGLMAWNALVVAAFVVSLSRSFWLGAIVAAAFMLPVLFRLGVVTLGELTALLRGTSLTLILAFLLVGAIAFFPFPRPMAGLGGVSDYGGRFLDSDDAAVTSRWNLLPPLREAIAAHPLLGSGFGTAVTYQSDDPRIHDLYPGGRITTTAIEWQYLEIWMKMGVLGLLAFVWLWWRIGRFFWRGLESAMGSDRLLTAGLMAAFLAFVLANVFTPYLNHPLGWMFLALVLTGLHAVQEHELPEHEQIPKPIPFG
jgi:O-antigen ligase